MATNITITLRRPGEDIVTVGTTADAKTLEFSITGNLSQNGSVYNCTAVNEIGPTSMSFTLVVRGELILTHNVQSFSLLPLSLLSSDIPGEVDSTKIASVPLTLLVSNVTWPAPISNNAEITNYTVTVFSTATDDCDNYTTPQPHAAVCTVPTVTYNTSVSATNVVGSSTSDTTTIVGTDGGWCFENSVEMVSKLCLPIFPLPKTFPFLPPFPSPLTLILSPLSSHLSLILSPLPFPPLSFFLLPHPPLFPHPSPS